MTAALFDTRPRDASGEAWLPESRRERPLFLAAAVTAAALHGLVFLIPVPRTATADLRPVPTTRPPVGRTAIPPPPLPLPVDRAPLAPRLVPWPATQPPDLRPPVERSVPNVPLAHSATPLVPVGEIEAPAPASRAIYDEHAPELDPPRALGARLQPDYPDMARLVRREGTVVLRAVVSPAGRVESIAVVAAPEPDLGFVEAARAAVATWRYVPGTVGGKPVSVEMTVIVEFTLN